MVCFGCSVIFGLAKQDTSLFDRKYFSHGLQGLKTNAVRKSAQEFASRKKK